MEYPNSVRLREWLEGHAGWSEDSASCASFILSDSEFAEQLNHMERHASVPPSERSDRAAFRCLTLSKVRPSAAISNQRDIKDRQFRREAWIRFGITVLLLLGLIVLTAVRGHAQQANVNPAIVVSSCSTQTLTAGQRVFITVDTAGGVCVGGITASIAISTSGLATAANQFPIQAVGVDRSGSIASGGTSQTLAMSNGLRKRMVIENPCTATSQGIVMPENLFINVTGGAASSTDGKSFEMVPCGAYDTGAGPLVTGAVTVVAATTGHLYTAIEQ